MLCIAHEIAEVHGVRIHSGDILVSRGGAPTSALIARGNDFPGNFSHIALVHVDASSAKVAIIEAHIEVGLGISSIEQYLDGKKLRVMVLRLRPDLPSMQADPLLPHKAASAALKRLGPATCRTSFEMNYRDPSKQFCAEVVSAVYEPRGSGSGPRCRGCVAGLRSWLAAFGFFSSPGLRSWLAAFGVTHFETQEPSDLEYDPQLSVAAEWRDSETLFQDHVDNAVVDALLEEAEAGVRLGYPWWKLPFARVAKAYSALLNSLGRVGRIPEGMSAEAALRYEGFNDRHKALRDRVLAKANDFRQRDGYRPPYWELVRLARKSRSEALD